MSVYTFRENAAKAQTTVTHNFLKFTILLMEETSIIRIATKEHHRLPSNL